jgi:hypothetical protein
MRTAIIALFTLGGIWLAALSPVACTTTAANSATGQDAGEQETIDQDAGDQSAHDASRGDAAPVKPTKIGDRCTGTCSAGQVCRGISTKGLHICLAACGSSPDCNGPGAEVCTDGACNPLCGKGCPSAMVCNPLATPSFHQSCVFDCESVPELCGPGEICDQQFSCKTPVPDAGPQQCAPGGGTPTSGLSAGKTVGALTSAEQATFCDWAAAVTGGYGCQSACDGGLSVEFASSQASCIAKFTKAGCGAKVSEVEACLKVNAQDVCAFAFATSPACATLRACP